MDPGTIIATIMASAKLAKYVGLFFEGAAAQKLELAALSTEISSLSNILASIGKNSRGLINSVGSACSQSQSELWNQFVATVQECKKILKGLDELMPARPNTDNETPRLKSRVKYAWNKSEIDVWTARLKALKGTMVGWNYNPMLE